DNASVFAENNAGQQLLSQFATANTATAAANACKCHLANSENNKDCLFVPFFHRLNRDIKSKKNHEHCK
ncbi:hypothetical protein, partial [Escherichia coli]|uniref:hypothetical protein n=1 Tax=Escherichia coli TaxID=562 RepID=UPI001BDB741C